MIQVLEDVLNVAFHFFCGGGGVCWNVLRQKMFVGHLRLSWLLPSASASWTCSA